MFSKLKHLEDVLFVMFKVIMVVRCFEVLEDVSKKIKHKVISSKHLSDVLRH